VKRVIRRIFGRPDDALPALWLWCAAVLAGMWVMASGAFAATAEERPIELRQGTVTTTVDGRTATAPLVLPYHWDRRHPGRPGLAIFDLPFALEAEPRAPWGIFIPRAGNVLEVWLNGTLLQAHGDLARGNGPDHAKAPIYVPVPGVLLKAGANRLQIRIRADGDRGAGLSRLTIGPAAVVRGELYERAHAWRFVGSVLLAAFGLVVGGISMALWFTQAEMDAAGQLRRDGVYLWAALAEFAWALRVADGVIADPPLAWPLWGVLMAACTAVWIASAIMFCLHFVGWNAEARLRWLRWVAAGVVAGSIVASALAFYREQPAWFTAWLALEIGCVALMVCAFTIAMVRRPSAERLLLAFGALATVGLGLRDWQVLRLGENYGETAWVRYSTVFLGLALLMIVLRRFHAASTEARGWVVSLAERVAQRERELASTFAALEQVARDQARTQERERILRDMHDSVGSRISSAIRQLQSEQASSGELMRTLSESLDQLKLSIDSIHLPPGDVGALLAALRYRMEPRLAAAGIAFEWAVDELPILKSLDVQAMRQLQFLLFEAISNVMQHAHAKTLRIEARKVAATVQVRVIDDGRGFDAKTVPRALAQRSAAIGARLAVESRPGRTVVQFALG